MSIGLDVAIVGAGPYGLSLAAHLKAAGVDAKVYGRPMDSWLRHMPHGMLLKSDGFASNLADPGDVFPLARFCAERSIPYADRGIPVSLDTFAAYGLEFAKRFVPDLDQRLVASVDRDGAGFKLRLDDGEWVNARNVVIAAGIGHFRYTPEGLRRLPDGYLSHGFDHNDLSPLKGKKVAVVGGGASAIDLAGLLQEAGADAHLVTRRTSLRFSGAPASGPPSVWSQIRHPPSGLGPGWRSRLSTDAPLVFHFLPQKLRSEIVRRHLGPAAGWPMKDRVIGRVPISYGSEIAGATVGAGGISLALQRRDGGRDTLEVEHVIAATGYRTDLRRLEFLQPNLAAQISVFEQTPNLSGSFESSVPGLYFIGPAAAVSFGPLMRFVFGARYVSRRVARALALSSRTQNAAGRFARPSSAAPPVGSPN